MQVTILEEHGLITALRGMSDSYRDEATPPDEYWTQERQTRALELAHNLAWKGRGHNKFLESITVSFRIRASRGWWSEFDTYRAGVTKQSCSTMHTLAKRTPTEADFDQNTPAEVIGTFINVWAKHKGNINVLKSALPEGFLQTRTVVTNYKTLQNIFAQRRGHRLKAWDVFLDEVKNGLMYPEWVEK